jgi:hypothetical protein
VGQRRDAKAGGVQHHPLLPHELRRALGRGDRGAAEDPGEVAEPVPARLFQRQRPPGREHVLHRGHGVAGVAVLSRPLAVAGVGIRQGAPDPAAAELGHLLLEAHLLEQQLGPVGRRERRVLPPGRHLVRDRARVWCRHGASFDKVSEVLETFRRDS